jgi:acyl carrier protein
MDRNQILNQVGEIINKSLLKPITIRPEDRLAEDIGLDSIGFVELGSALEDLYQLDVEDETLLGLRTVAQVIDLVMTCPRHSH